MTDADRRLATLAAVLAPAVAPALLARAGPAAADTVAHAARVAASPRRERLRALAAALSRDRGAARASADAAAAAERPRIAAVLRGVAAGRPTPGDPAILVRLCRERVAR